MSMIGVVYIRMGDMETNCPKRALCIKTLVHESWMRCHDLRHSITMFLHCIGGLPEQSMPSVIASVV